MRNIYYNKSIRSSSNNLSVPKSTKKENEDRITAPNAIEGNRSSGSNPNESDACDQCVEISEKHTHSELSLTTIVLVFSVVCSVAKWVCCGCMLNDDHIRFVTCMSLSQNVTFAWPLIYSFLSGQRKKAWKLKFFSRKNSRKRERSWQKSENVR